MGRLDCPAGSEAWDLQIAPLVAFFSGAFSVSLKKDHPRRVSQAARILELQALSFQCRISSCPFFFPPESYLTLQGLFISIFQKTSPFIRENYWRWVEGIRTQCHFRAPPTHLTRPLVVSSVLQLSRDSGQGEERLDFSWQCISLKALRFHLPCSANSFLFTPNTLFLHMLRFGATYLLISSKDECFSFLFLLFWGKWYKGREMDSVALHFLSPPLLKLKAPHHHF